jgi:hypothetical protein
LVVHYACSCADSIGIGNNGKANSLCACLMTMTIGASIKAVCS